MNFSRFEFPVSLNGNYKTLLFVNFDIYAAMLYCSQKTNSIATEHAVSSGIVDDVTRI